MSDDRRGEKEPEPGGRLAGAESNAPPLRQPRQGLAPFTNGDLKRRITSMGTDPEAAIDPSYAGLSEDRVATVWRSIVPLMKALGQSGPDLHTRTLLRMGPQLGFDTADEASGVLAGLAAWARAHPPRAKVLADLSALHVDFGRGWPSSLPEGSCAALKARALFYCRQPAWRDVARGWAGGEQIRAGDRAEDLTLWLAGLVEWARSHSERVNYHTTGELREPLLAALGLGRPDEEWLEGVVRASLLGVSEPWYQVLVGLGDLAVLSSGLLVDLVRRLYVAGFPDDPSGVASQWSADHAHEIGPFGEPWRQAAVVGVATRLISVLLRYDRVLRDSRMPEDFEDRVSVDRHRPFGWTSYVRPAEVPEAWEALKEIHLGFVSSPGGSSASPKRDYWIPASSERPLVVGGAAAAGGPTPDESEQVIDATWKYGLRLIARHPLLGYRIVLPVADRNWGRYGPELLAILGRQAPSSEEALTQILAVVTDGGRTEAVAHVLLAALAQGRPSRSTARLLVRCLSRLEPDRLTVHLEPCAAFLLDRRAEFTFIFSEVMDLFLRLNDPEKSLDFCLRWYERNPAAGVEPLVRAARLAHSIPDWHKGGKRVLQAARNEAGVALGLWVEILNMCDVRGMLPQALGVLLCWVLHVANEAGEEKTNQTQAREWKLALEVAQLIADWDTGHAQILGAAQESRCQVPAVWRALVLEAQVRGLPRAVRECTKRFIEAWGRDEQITMVLWAIFEKEAHSPVRQEEELVDLLHWLHVDLGHHRWTAEEEFLERIISPPNVDAGVLARWAMRRVYSSRRWMLLGKALAENSEALDALVDVVSSLGPALTQAFEGLLRGLPEERGWSFLVRLLPGAGRGLEWAWLAALERCKVDPGRAPELTRILGALPAGFGGSSALASAVSEFKRARQE